MHPHIEQALIELEEGCLLISYQILFDSNPSKALGFVE